MSRRLIYALAAMSVAQAAVYVARPMTSYRLIGLGEGAGTVGLVAASFALVPLFVAIPLGRYSDRRHAGSLLGLGAAAQTAACLLLAVAETTLGITGATILLGLGHLALALGVQDVIARESDDSRHDQHFGILAAGISAGQLVGPLVGGVILSRHEGSLTEGTSLAMLVAAAITGVATVLAVLTQHSREGAGPAVVRAVQRVPVRTILRTPGVPAGIFASVAVLTAADVFTAYMPVLGEDEGIGPGLVGVLLAVRAGASIVSRIGLGTIVQRVGRLRLISIAATAAAVALVGITLTVDPLVLAVLAATLGLGLGFGQPLSMTIVVRLVPENARATALAVRLTGNRLGQVAVPAIAGVVAGGAGVAAAYWLLAVLLVGSAAAVRRPALERQEREHGRMSDEASAPASME